MTSGDDQAVPPVKTGVLSGESPAGNAHVLEFLQGEYAVLRGELIKRVEFRQRLVEITLASTAAILAINLTGAEFARVLLVYPVLVLFLALAWLHHGLRLPVLADYIKTEIEPKFPWLSEGEVLPVGYESWLDRNPHRKEQPLGTRASKSLFIGMQILVFGLGLVAASAKPGYQHVDMLLAVVGGLAIVTTGVALFHFRWA